MGRSCIVAFSSRLFSGLECFFLARICEELTLTKVAHLNHGSNPASHSCKSSTPPINISDIEITFCQEDPSSYVVL